MSRGKKVVVIDYGVGNLLNVVRALEHCGATVRIAWKGTALDAPDRLVLPGVGAFGDGMSELRALDFIVPIHRFAETGRPFLGICLGMQMMFERSGEFGMHDGLGLIPGEVVPVPRVGGDGYPHKVPHIGWNELRLSGGRATWKDTVLEPLNPGTPVYFVHSFMAEPAEAVHGLACCDYDGVAICAAVQSGPLFGCQFHPEKSGEAGLNVLRQFLKL